MTTSADIKVATKNVLLDRVVACGVIAELQKVIVANRGVKANVHLHLHPHLHLHTQSDDAECKLEVENVLLDCVVVHLVGVEPQNIIVPNSGVKVSATL
uniref:Chitin-binding lectin n=1 Tax=Solanum tuberosum TaxID=4113 RepID=M1BQ04_SOLTU